MSEQALLAQRSGSDRVRMVCQIDLARRLTGAGLALLTARSILAQPVAGALCITADAADVRLRIHVSHFPAGHE